MTLSLYGSLGALILLVQRDAPAYVRPSQYVSLAVEEDLVC